jgi:uncharacterized protein (DUF983 family)
MLLGRCPRCRNGAIFEPLFSGGIFTMNEACPVCGLLFERETGYFIGGMYVSYTLGVLTVLPVAVLLAVVYAVPVALVILVALLQTFASMPLFYRYSRIVWLHTDQMIDPR